MISVTSVKSPKQTDRTDIKALNAKTRTGNKIPQTKEKKSGEIKSEVLKSGSKKSGQKKSDNKKPEVLMSSDKWDGSSRYRVQLSPAPHADCQAEVEEKLDSLQSSQKNSLQKGKKVSGQGWPERRKLPPLPKGEITQKVGESYCK